MKEIPLVNLRLTFKAIDDIVFPNYAGSTLRGAFGNALKKISCLQKEKSTCFGCSINECCPYSKIFENSFDRKNDIPNPYVIEPNMTVKTVKSGDLFDFNLILFGQAIDRISYILLSWHKASKKGYTVNRRRAEFVKVEQINQDGETKLIYDFENKYGNFNQLDKIFILKDCNKYPSTIKVKIQTPMRIIHQAHPVKPNELTARDFIISLLRREQKLILNHSKDVDFPMFSDLISNIDQIKLSNICLRWYDWTRYSNRQKKQIALGGIIGEFELIGDLQKLYPFLMLGEILHVGKSAVMGMGKYKIIE